MLFGAEHVRRYQETDGAEGYEWGPHGGTILLLTTTGRRTGAQRTNALLFRQWGDDYLLVASKGGADTPPDWYRNLRDDPEVQVQVKGERFTARARVATAEEKPAMWAFMTGVWPDYDGYQRKTDREIPVVVLERA